MNQAGTMATFLEKMRELSGKAAPTKNIPPGIFALYDDGKVAAGDLMHCEPESYPRLARALCKSVDAWGVVIGAEAFVADEAITKGELAAAQRGETGLREGILLNWECEREGGVWLAILSGELPARKVAPWEHLGSHSLNLLPGSGGS